MFNRFITAGLTAGLLAMSSGLVSAQSATNTAPPSIVVSPGGYVAGGFTGPSINVPSRTYTFTADGNAPTAADLGTAGGSAFASGSPSFGAGPLFSNLYVRGTLGLAESGEWTLKDSAAADRMFGDDERREMIHARLGKMLTPNFGIEGRLGTILGDAQKVDVAGTENEFAVGMFGGIFARFQQTMASGLTPYLNLGLGGVKAEAKSGTGATAHSSEETEMGLSAAAGLEMNVAENLVIGVDAFMLPNKVRGVGVSIGMNF